MAEENYYDVLGVSRDASEDEIKKAWRVAAKGAHPDRKGGSHERMSLINRAYQVLSDPERRANYDRTGFDFQASIDAEAESIVMQGFLAAIQSRVDNPLKFVIDGVLNAKRSITEQKLEAEQEFTRLERMRGKVKRKKGLAGRNAYLLMLEEELNSGRTFIAKAARELKIQSRAIEYLKEYEAVAAPEKGPSLYQIVYGKEGKSW